MVTPRIAYEQVGPERATEVARLITDIRQDVYGLEAGTLAYEELVTEVLDKFAIESLAKHLEDPKSFHVGATTETGEIVGLAIGARGQDVDVLEHLFVRTPRQGIGSELMRRFIGWSTAASQIVWIVSDNKPARIFYEGFGFSLAKAPPPDRRTGLSYIELKREKGVQE
jgi:ribosomal protein S18 acetylase RimI-like enzyme